MPGELGGDSAWGWRGEDDQTRHILCKFKIQTQPKQYSVHLDYEQDTE